MTKPEKNRPNIDEVPKEVKIHEETTSEFLQEFSDEICEECPALKQYQKLEVENKALVGRLREQGNTGKRIRELEDELAIAKEERNGFAYTFIATKELLNEIVSEKEAVEKRIGEAIKQIAQLDADFPSLNSGKYYAKKGNFRWKLWQTDIVKWRDKYQDFRFGAILEGEKK